MRKFCSKKSSDFINRLLSIAFFLPISMASVYAQQVPPQRQLIERQLQFWNRAVKFWAEKQYTPALTSIEQIKQLQQSLDGPYGYTMAFLEDVRTELENDRGDWRLVPPPQRNLWMLCQIEARPAGDKQARRRLETIVSLRESLAGKKSVWAALAVMDLAHQLHREGNLESAQTYWERAVDALAKRSTDKSVDWRIRNRIRSRLADSRHQLAHVLLSRGKMAEARKLAEENANKFRDIRHQVLLARIHLVRGDAAALDKLPWSNMIYNAFMHVNNAATHLSEREHFRLAGCAREVVDLYFSFHRAHKKGPLETWLGKNITQSKGSVFISQSRYRSERRHPSLTPLFKEIDRINQRLAALLAPGSQESLTAKAKAEVQALSEARAKVQIELARRRSRLPQYMNLPVHMQLAPKVVLLDFYEYNRFAVQKAQQQRRLACVICRKDMKQPYWFVDLGPAEPIGELVRKWRWAIQKRRGGYARGFVRAVQSPKDNTHELAQTLRDKVWLPIERHVKDAELVLLAPDGVLSFLPFAALPGKKKGTFLIEEKSLAYAPVPHLIKPFRSFSNPPAKKASAGMLLVGGVDFRAPAKRNAGNEKQGGLHFDALPGTEKEIAHVAEVFRRAFPKSSIALLRGLSATKTAFRKEVATRRWLHLATHGFFLPGMGDDLGNRSGLAFAGANHPGADGLLTALEVSGLDLSQSELAVLSACETSLGKVVRGEGVRGLQAAFQIAGAKTVVATLWPVHDEATQRFMIAFYRNLWQRKNGRLQALRQAQIDMLHGKLYRPPDASKAGEGFRLSPYYWGPFVLSGTWN